jgi:phage gpG-like protein
MIEGWITGDKELVARLEAMPARLNGSIGRAVPALMQGLDESVRAKLSGEVLNARTGMLRGTIVSRIDQTRDSVTAIVGVDVPYAAIHEYGFQGTENVRAQLRKIIKAFGKDLKSPVTVSVGAHGRKVDFPERSFLCSALAQMEERIKDELTQAAREAINA